MHRMRERRKDPAQQTKDVAYTKAWKKTHPELAAKHQASYCRKNARRLNVATAKWKRDNWDYYKAYLIASKKRTSNATPPWLDKQSLITILKEGPKGHHVDHIIPVTHKDVCGLNVPWNLQYLTKAENLAKSNKFDINKPLKYLKLMEQHYQAIDKSFAQLETQGDTNEPNPPVQNPIPGIGQSIPTGESASDKSDTPSAP
jgi:hypothetical protein